MPALTSINLASVAMDEAAGRRQPPFENPQGKMLQRVRILPIHSPNDDAVSHLLFLKLDISLDLSRAKQKTELSI